MRVLLDTHALLWALASPDRLGERARAVIADRSTMLLVSAASAWEIATKVRLGRLPGAEALVERYSEHLDRLGAAELPVSSRHALAAGRFRWDHRDPFDRMLAAQSVLEDVPLVSVDRAFGGLASVSSIW